MTTLADKFPDADVLHFTGRGGKTFDYIEDETVMDRLDEVVGALNWSIHVEPISLAEGVVKVTLDVGGATYQDFGYTSNADGEVLKEAVSDGIRRVGRMAGIGRYLYHKHSSNGSGGVPSQPVRPPATAGVRPPAVANPYDDPYPANLAELDNGPAPEAVCPIHKKAWKQNSRGYYCSSKLEDGSWCKEQPRR